MSMNGQDPIRTIVPRTVGIGVARVGGELHALLRMDDDLTGGTLDVLIDKATLGELIAHGDEVRRRIQEPATP